MDDFILVQIFGVMTLIFYVASLQQSKKEAFLLLQMGGALFFVAQYALTNRITGVVTFSIIVVRSIVFYLYKRKGIKPSLKVLILFLSIIVVATYFSWQNALSVLPFVSTLGKSWGTWQDEMKWMRRTSLFAQSCMIVYNVTAAMYTGTFTEVCNLTSTTIAIWRYDIRKKKVAAVTEPELSETEQAVGGTEQAEQVAEDTE